MSRDYAIEENVKLQSEIRTLKDEKKSLAQMLAAKDAEIAELKANVLELQSLYVIRTPWIDPQDEITELKEQHAREIERLRRALEAEGAEEGNTEPEQKPETCVWSEQSTSCNAEPSHSLIWFAAELTFCPFCGKRVEVRG